MLHDIVELNLRVRLLSLYWVYLLDLVFGVIDHVVTFPVELREAELQTILIVEKHQSADVALELVLGVVR